MDNCMPKYKSRVRQLRQNFATCTMVCPTRTFSAKLPDDLATHCFVQPLLTMVIEVSTGVLPSIGTAIPIDFPNARRQPPKSRPRSLAALAGRTADLSCPKQSMECRCRVSTNSIKVTRAQRRCSQLSRDFPDRWRGLGEAHRNMSVVRTEIRQDGTDSATPSPSDHTLIASSTLKPSHRGSSNHGLEAGSSMIARTRM